MSNKAGPRKKATKRKRKPQRRRKQDSMTWGSEVTITKPDGSTVVIKPDNRSSGWSK